MTTKLATRPLAGTTSFIPKEVTKQEIAAAAAAAIRIKFPGFSKLKSISLGETLELDELRALPVRGSALESVAMAAHALGAVKDVPNTIGGTMDAAHLTEGDVHELACDCKGDRTTVTALGTLDRIAGEA